MSITKTIDLTGKQLGAVTVIGLNEYKSRGRNWKCFCGVCQSEFIEITAKLLGARKYSCGCIDQKKYERNSAKTDVNSVCVGFRIGKLEITRPAFQSKRGSSWWLICECGKEIKLSTTMILAKEKNDCGCLISKKITKEQLLDTFERNFKKSNSCWLWTGRIGKDGYGLFNSAGKYSVRAHRASYELYIGTIENKKHYVCHSCDTPLCVNPSHLFLGTQLDNMQDMALKGRSRLKISLTQKQWVIDNYVPFDPIYGQRPMAEALGVHSGVIQRIVSQLKKRKK